MVRRNGTVAVVHYNSNGSEELIGGRLYLFRPRYAISLAWIDEQDVPFLLSKRINGCCGTSHSKYALASERQVSVYETGGY